MSIQIGSRWGEWTVLSAHPHYQALYTCWTDMCRRCTNHERPEYHNYGGRGISVCLEWKHSFACFYAWALSGFKAGLSLDCIDNNGDYSPANCRWATSKMQSRNKRTNRVTSATVLQIRNEFKSGVRQCELAHRFGLSAVMIHNIVRDKRWVADEHAV